MEKKKNLSNKNIIFTDSNMEEEDNYEFISIDDFQ